MIIGISGFFLTFDCTETIILSFFIFFAYAISLFHHFLKNLEIFVILVYLSNPPPNTALNHSTSKLKSFLLFLNKKHNWLNLFFSYFLLAMF